MIKTEDLKPGTRFRRNSDLAEMEIVKVENWSAYVRELKTGYLYHYGLGVLSRCGTTISKEGGR
nr:MAG TPA: hypothetical protein [Caudoviricetes sp.]